jgi:hypothetical protein
MESQVFPGPGKEQNSRTFKDFSGDVGTPSLSRARVENTQYKHDVDETIKVSIEGDETMKSIQRCHLKV